jgi:hypothetical protein
MLRKSFVVATLLAAASCGDNQLLPSSVEVKGTHSRVRVGLFDQRQEFISDLELVNGKAEFTEANNFTIVVSTKKPPSAMSVHTIGEIAF